MSPPHHTSPTRDNVYSKDENHTLGQYYILHLVDATPASTCQNASRFVALLQRRGMLKKLGILAAVLTASLAAAVPALAQETIPTALTQPPNPGLLQSPDGPLENQNDTCTDELLEREPDTDARDCAREEDGTPRGTQLIEDTKQKAVDDEFGASSDGDDTKDAPSTVSEGAQRPDAERDEAPAVSPTEKTGATPQAGAQLKTRAESEDFEKDSSGESKTPEKRVANTEEDTAGETGLSEEMVSGGRIVSKGSVPKGNARKAATKKGTARTDSGARKAVRKEARKTTKTKSVSKEDRKVAREQVTPDKDTSVSEETTDREDAVTDGGATPGDGGGGEGDDTTVVNPTKSNVPMFLGGGLLFVMSIFLISKAVLWWFRSPLSRRRWLLRSWDFNSTSYDSDHPWQKDVVHPTRMRRAPT